MSQWYAEGTPNVEARHEMYAHLADWFKTGRLKSTSVNECDVNDFKSVIEEASGTSNVKQLFVL